LTLVAGNLLIQEHAQRTTQPVQESLR